MIGRLQLHSAKSVISGEREKNGQGKTYSNTTLGYSWPASVQKYGYIG